MKTKREIEAAISKEISRFEQEYMGRGPKDINVHLLGDLLLIRLRGVLVAAEQDMVKSLPAEKGQDLLKQVWTNLAETARPVMEAMVEKLTGVKVVAMHHDVSTITGEEIILFTLARSADFREAKIGIQNSVSGCVAIMSSHIPECPVSRPARLHRLDRKMTVWHIPFQLGLDALGKFQVSKDLFDRWLFRLAELTILLCGTLLLARPGRAESSAASYTQQVFPPIWLYRPRSFSKTRLPPAQPE